MQIYTRSVMDPPKPPSPVKEVVTPPESQVQPENTSNTMYRNTDRQRKKSKMTDEEILEKLSKLLKICLFYGSLAIHLLHLHAFMKKSNLIRGLSIHSKR